MDTDVRDHLPTEVSMLNPYAPLSVSESIKSNTAWLRPAGFAFIAAGLVMLVIGNTFLRPVPTGLIAIWSLLALCPGIAMVALSLPQTTESEKRRRTLVWLLIPIVAAVVIGGTLVFHTL